jgi:hypothetical protein
MACWLHARVWLMGFLATADSGAVLATPLEPLGVTVTPHVRAESMRYRREPTPERGARVQLFLRAGETVTLAPPRFGGQAAEARLADRSWAWHDTPAIWNDAERAVPAGALVVWHFNQTEWTPGETLAVEGATAAVSPPLKFDLAAPTAWLSAVTFLGPTNSVQPVECFGYVVNESGADLRPAAVRLWLPESNPNFRHLRPRPWSQSLSTLPADGWIPPGDKGGFRLKTGPLPLTYAALEVKVLDRAGQNRTLWAHLRIKRECFDISAGWVTGDVNGRNPITFEPYLKTLRRLHVNTAHLADTPGYTDSTGPDGLYTRYPLKYFHKLEPFHHYDTDALLPRIHAVEFLGEPQYGGGRPVPPMEVFTNLLPYAATRLPTTVTHSEERVWRAYAGLSDYAHYDAYRVSAPAADAWRRYDRWDGVRIAWGAPLETIGDMCRSLRELYRPAPVAYWSQGPHYDWGVYGGRRRTSPTPDELRLQAYHALATRITSLYWFNLSLRSLVKWRDTLDELNRVGREIRLLEEFYLTGDAYRFRQTRRDGRLDWDLASLVAPRGALLFALDLDYFPHPTERVFTFRTPRDATFAFDLPPWLRAPADVFRVDADGVHETRWTATASGVEIRDTQNRVAIYVATPERELRHELQRRARDLVAFEESFGFDPARNDADFATLRAFLDAK